MPSGYAILAARVTVRAGRCTETTLLFNKSA
jgi:hypothetical protein